MNIQIFGTKKCNDTKKAERFFKERGIKFQFIDMKEKGMSKGELTSVASANGGIMNMIDPDAKDKDAVALIQYIADEDKLEKLLLSGKIKPRIVIPVLEYFLYLLLCFLTYSNIHNCNGTCNGRNSRLQPRRAPCR